MVATLCFTFVVVGCVLIGFALVDALIGFIFDRKHGPNNVVPDCAGSILIYTQDGEAYLFLDTELTPGDLSKKSEVIFKVETRNMQAPL